MSAGVQGVTQRHQCHTVTSDTAANRWTVYDLGQWLAEKWAARLTESGRDYAGVARQMRKQGFPLEVALALLVGRSVQQ